MAECHINLSDWSDDRSLYEEYVNAYPKDAQTEMARQRMDILKNLNRYQTLLSDNDVQRNKDDAQYQIGRLYLTGAENRGPARNWLASARDHDLEAAEAARAALFPNDVVVAKDVDAAAYWIGEAAAAGKAEAQALLGDLYRHGVGCPRDYAQASRWYEAAAASGVAAAEFGLGDIYFQGLGVAVDCARAADCYERAAEQGLAKAKVALAFIYQTGAGRPADLQRAGRLFVEAGYVEIAIVRHQ